MGAKKVGFVGYKVDVHSKIKIDGDGQKTIRNRYGVTTNLGNLKEKNKDLLVATIYKYKPSPAVENTGHFDAIFGENEKGYKSLKSFEVENLDAIKSELLSLDWILILINEKLVDWILLLILRLALCRNMILL